MRKIQQLLCCIGVFLSITQSTQAQNNTRKIISLLTPQSFKLNGGLNAAFVGGKSRTYYEITIPAGTVEWYFSFSASKAPQNASALQLVTQLTRLVDPSGTTALAVSALTSPEGADVCDIMVMDGVNTNLFMQKADLNGKRIDANISASRANYRNGTVQVRDWIMPGKYYIGFKNPSSSAPINISLEAAAIVEETSINPNSETAVNYGNLAWKAYEQGDINKCIDYSKKALTLDNTLGYVKANIGLCYLINADDVSATDYYIQALTDFKKIVDKQVKRNYMLATIKDINDALKKKPEIKGAAEIKSLYQTEIMRSF